MKTLKTFTATHLNKHAQEVFEEAKEHGTALIKHDRFRNGRFAIVWNPSYSEEEALKQMSGCEHKNTGPDFMNNCRKCLDCGQELRGDKDGE